MMCFDTCPFDPLQLFVETVMAKKRVEGEGIEEEDEGGDSDSLLRHLRFLKH
jgi:hypothetical protein